MPQDQFIDKFNLLKEIEEEVNNGITLDMNYNPSTKDYTIVPNNLDQFSSITIESEFGYLSVYFDKWSKDNCHDLYDHRHTRIEFPYFRDMIFEDVAVFILQDEYKISKFIKLIPIDLLEEYLSKLKEMGDVWFHYKV